MAAVSVGLSVSFDLPICRLNYLGGKYLYQMCKRDVKEHCERCVQLTFGAAHTLEGKVQCVTVEWEPGETRGK